MKVLIILGNEERKKIQLENNIQRPRDLKDHFACFLECDPEDIKIQLQGKFEKTLETEMTASDIQKLKALGTLTKHIFVTRLILKYKKRAYRKRKKGGAPQNVPEPIDERNV